MNYCVCCNSEVELPEGSQVCYKCKDIARDEVKILAKLTLEEIDLDIKQAKHHLYDLKLRRKLIEKAVRI